MEGVKPIIKIEDLTKDYGEGRGIFDVDLEVYEGDMVGFVGTNGSGKTTTIRNIMGFLKPTKGHAYVGGKEAWTHSSEIVKDIGYVPGEIAFPDLATGTGFLKSQAEFLGVKDMSYANYLIEKLQLDPRAPLKRMSKGMKQKTAIVAALMADPKILI
jgi:ABC-2 type transport system ATP-binding protein